MLNKILITGVSLSLALTVVFTGHAPDVVYKLIPGYFSDPNNAWDDSPLTLRKVTEARLPERA